MIDGQHIDYALRRAAQRVPGPVAQRSLAQAKPIRLMADYHDVPLTEPAVRAGPLRLGPSETWCTRCGSDGTVYADGDSRVDPAQRCVRCGHLNLVPATSVLRPDEYYIAS